MEDKSFDEVIARILKEEMDGNLESAVSILLTAMESELNKSTIYLYLLELANLYFRNEEDLKALQCYIKLYNILKQQEVLDFILNRYYAPNASALQYNYTSNKEVLNKYQHFHGEFTPIENLETIPIWEDENQIIYFAKDEFINYYKSTINDNITKENVLVTNDLFIQSILTYEENTNKKIDLLTMDEPMYLYYDTDIFELALQLLDFNKIVELKRVVIIVGIKQLEDYFRDYQSILPNYILGQSNNNLNNMITNINKERYDYILNYCIPSINNYYLENKDTIIKNIKSGKPKILFLTSRFTTVLQYHTRDMKHAAELLGLETEIAIEKSDLHRTMGLDFYNKIFEFKPDIIFCIDHFRFEYQCIPENLIWICWTQDPMQHIMDPNTPDKLLFSDFILNHFTTWNEFIRIGYPAKKLIDAPIPANDEIYKKYELTDEEVRNFSCDICFVCHASNYVTEVNRLLSNISEQFVKDAVNQVCKEYYDMAYSDSKFYYSREEFINFLSESLEQKNIKLMDEGIDVLAEQFYYYINQKLFRIILVRWLIEAGFHNIKLWGNGWLDIPEFSQYAMGPAENGTTLSKIYQASKIVIGNNLMTTAAARVWESMLSGTFYLSNYIPPECDITDIRKILIENEDFVMFYNRDDLVNKINYYLTNESERQKMIKIGQAKAIEHMTFKGLMKKTLKILQEKFN